jgi:hypothetical protein
MIRNFHSYFDIHNFSSFGCVFSLTDLEISDVYAWICVPAGDFSSTVLFVMRYVC